MCYGLRFAVTTINLKETEKMFKKISAAIVSAGGLSALQASTQSQIDSANVLIACRQQEAAAIDARASNFENVAEQLRQEAADKREEATRAGKWAAKLEKTLA
jgi:hypothetical protein